jgi:hypothetical protein
VDKKFNILFRAYFLDRFFSASSQLLLNTCLRREDLVCRQHHSRSFGVYRSYANKAVDSLADIRHKFFAAQIECALPVSNSALYSPCRELFVCSFYIPVAPKGVLASKCTYSWANTVTVCPQCPYRTICRHTTGIDPIALRTLRIPIRRGHLPRVSTI